jgi:hypothetical protein
MCVDSRLVSNSEHGLCVDVLCLKIGVLTTTDGCSTPLIDTVLYL